MGNTATNVQAGKPNIKGAIYFAPLGTALPTNTKDALDKAFECLGYISEDGVSNENATENTDVKAWGGDVVLSTQTSKTDTWSYKLLESLNVAVLKAIYGADNVTGDLTTGLTIKVTTEEIPAGVYVIDTSMGTANKRIVIPNGKISDMETITYKDDEPVGYGVTVTGISTYVESAGKSVTHLEYLLTA